LQLTKPAGVLAGNRLPDIGKGRWYGHVLCCLAPAYGLVWVISCGHQLAVQVWSRRFEIIHEIGQDTKFVIELEEAKAGSSLSVGGHRSGLATRFLAHDQLGIPGIA